jgi:uncharacterized protein YndB with AHSA1/START domain
MSNPVIEKAITIKASKEKVWAVFTNPRVTRKMGGEYATDWNIGSSLGWKDLDGQMYTNGTILELETEQLIKHNLFDLNDKDKLLSEITYRFDNKEGNTILSAREEINYEMTEDELEEAEEGWDLALQSIKEIAEKR